MNTSFFITNHLIFLFCHFCVWTLFFLLVQRPIFCLYCKKVSKKPLTRKTLMQIFRHGLYTDVKVAAYMTALPLLLLWAHAHAPHFNVNACIMVCDLLMAFVVAALCVADTALYPFWQFKIEASVLAYLRSLRGATASVSTTYVVVFILSVLAGTALLAALLLPLVGWLLPSIPAKTIPWGEHIAIAVVYLFLVYALFCIIRGFHRRPDTPVYSYFCNTPFFNHCAVNPVFNFIYSLTVNDDFAHQFQTYDKTFCEEKFTQLYPPNTSPDTSLLNTQRPNILFVVWESLFSHFTGCLGGKPEVMPQFDRLAKEGILFTNCWAGSWRTDRGLVCLLSGYLGQPTTTVIRYTSKLPHLPGLPRTLRDQAGYDTTVVHGGQLSIFHKSDYYWASGHDRLVERKDFPADAPTGGKWGIHDGYIFSWLADEIVRKSEGDKPFYITFQTLSSHEPFNVPYHRIKEDMVENSFAYVDEEFGAFVDKLKASPAWKDLLIVVTGDHGIDIGVVEDEYRNTHLPLLLLGGAIRQPMQIDTLMNQTDIAATLLGQLGLPHDDFIFSRDVFAPSYTYPFAFHTYTNGFIFRDATGVTHYDNVSQTAIEGHDPQREENAKVILQTLYTDLSKR